MRAFVLAVVVASVLGDGVLAVTVEKGCRYKGSIYQNNETWKEKESFVMRCVIESNGSWRTEVHGCIAPNGVEVPVGTSKSDGKVEWICESNSADGTVTLKQKRGERADCDGHEHGSRWVEKAFEFECAAGGVPRFIGCVASNGVKIAEGQIAEVNGFNVRCVKHDNGTVALEGLPKEKNADCVDKEGAKHPHGATWVENVMFEYVCDDYGVKRVKGCVVKDQGLQIPINETRSAGNIVFHCESKDGSFRFFTSQKTA